MRVPEKVFPVRRVAAWTAALCVSAAAAGMWAQTAPVTAQIEIVQTGGKPAAKGQAATDPSDVAVWLVPLDETARRGAQAARPHLPARLIQKNKSFEPHVVVVQVGSSIQFPNEDPFFHNVFSLFDGKRFDLGLYEAGTSKSVRFDRAGVSYLFCNIHPEMSAVVVTVETPFYALSDRSGKVAIAGVPNGRYELQVWFERGVADNLKSLARAVMIDDASRSLGRIQVAANPDFTLAHKNKYGQDYVPPAAGATGYPRP